MSWHRIALALFGAALFTALLPAAFAQGPIGDILEQPFDQQDGFFGWQTVGDGHLGWSPLDAGGIPARGLCCSK